jgi:hypothetical protein
VNSILDRGGSAISIQADISKPAEIGDCSAKPKGEGTSRHRCRQCGDPRKVHHLERWLDRFCGPPRSTKLGF